MQELITRNFDAIALVIMATLENSNDFTFVQKQFNTESMNFAIV